MKMRSCEEVSGRDRRLERISVSLNIGRDMAQLVQFGLLSPEHRGETAIDLCCTR
jgi:hypothetical protein